VEHGDAIGEAGVGDAPGRVLVLPVEIVGRRDPAAEPVAAWTAKLPSRCRSRRRGLAAQTELAADSIELARDASTIRGWRGVEDPHEYVIARRGQREELVAEGR